MKENIFDKTIEENGHIINYKNFIINKNSKDISIEVIFENDLVFLNLKNLDKRLTKVIMISDSTKNEVYFSLLFKEQQVEVLKLREIHLKTINKKKT